MNATFDTLTQIITQRRTIKPAHMNGQLIPNDTVTQILALANWAPTHGRTEPWRFVVFAHDKVAQYCLLHAELYKTHTPAEQFLEATYHNFLHQGDKASHVVLAYMQRGNLPKIPPVEEVAATSCAIQNVLLGAQALGIAAYWGSGGMILKQPFKDWLQLHPDDQVLGALFLGYTEEVTVGKRNTDIDAKIKWW
ncbi:MAG TPA: nitroreductase [Chitinophagaceae bacterium]|nr:nitroreductase [Chitinophagaceae bacterium]HAN38739.1 nitroreductase [Chitinophagaceae bacterium]